MKPYFKISLLIIFLITISAIALKKSNAQSSVSFQVFYDDLSPYGQWIDYPGYGYVWMPMYEAGFSPYSTAGHWVWTYYGWTWVSDYSWGWAPFHYGRWSFDDYYGWIWIPDNIWGPAWVSWRTCPGYYGWTPLEPGITIIVATGNYNPPADHWVFVHDQYMGRDDINTYYGPRKNNTELINSSTVINNTYVDKGRNQTYIAGPPKDDVQKITGRTIKPVEIKEDSKPGQTLKNNELVIYRPVITNSSANNAKPSKITDKKDVKPVSERNKQVEQKNKANPTEKDKENTTINKTPSSEERKPENKTIQQNQSPKSNKQNNNGSPDKTQSPPPQKQEPIRQAEPVKIPKQNPEKDNIRVVPPQPQKPIPQQQPKVQPMPPQQRQQAAPRRPH